MTIVDKTCKEPKFARNIHILKFCNYCSDFISSIEYIYNDNYYSI